MRGLPDGVELVEFLAVHEVEQLLQARLDLDGLDDVVEVRAVERHVAAQRDRHPVRQVLVQELVELLDERLGVPGLLGLRFVLHELDGGLLVPDLRVGVDHRAVRDAGRVERLPQLGVGEDHPVQGVLVVHPRELVLVHEIACFARSLAHQMASILGAIVQVHVPGAAHAAAPFATH